MSTMAPNLYVLKYLTATKQMNSKLYGRIVKNLKIGTGKQKRDTALDRP